ncbi:hydroxysqualene dehydroxylase HpnE [Massilia sp. S19_KUP03_FR1]|uniref:hydroxysqualene dehydroxylase HpnE n=1 Tax=Massilia sp. S19_KUP03_FR1 TaxID=3025503 RepID=UPI002FCDDF26
MCATRTVAVVGAGWAGCTAAVELARRGHTVTLFEASRTLGGRARAFEFNSQVLDNGQHILLGAYSQTLAIMKRVGVDARSALLRLPLQMRYPPGSGGMDFIAARLPAPLHVGVALLRATGLSRADKLSLARFNTSARWMGWTLHVDCSVAELLARFDQTDNLIRLMWRPLCLAALNTPLEQASAKVFLAVLRDSLGARRKASDMLLPRVDLGTLFPVAAGRYVEQHGGTVRLGANVNQLAFDGQWHVHGAQAFDAVVLATPPGQSAHLLRDIPGAAATVAQLDAFTYEPIVTVYLQYDAALRLARPMYALLDDAAVGHWGQFVFDRGQLDAAQAGLLSVVVSAATAATRLDQGMLAEAVAGQLAAALQLPALQQPAWTRVIAEKRATFACSAGLQRPGNQIGVPGLVLAGDYTASDYPATLESAVRSGLAAAKLL